MRARELAAILMLRPDAEVFAHWEGWVAANFGDLPLWEDEDGDLYLDCNKEYDRIKGDEAKILGGLPIKRVLRPTPGEEAA
jgi:hypothetical protein